MSNKTKMDQLTIMIAKTSAYAVVITESWLTEEILDAEVAIQGFSIYRADRSGCKRGGVCLFLRNDILAQVCLSKTAGLTEALVVKVKSLKAVIFIVYKSQYVNTQQFVDTMAGRATGHNKGPN